MTTKALLNLNPNKQLTRIKAKLTTHLQRLHKPKIGHLTKNLSLTSSSITIKRIRW